MADPEPKKRDFARTLWRRLPVSLGILTVILVMQRVLLRDHVPYLAAVFYAFPPVMLMLLAGAGAGAAGFQKRWKGAGAFLVAVGVFFAWHVASSYRGNESVSGEKPSLRTVCWNVGGGLKGWDQVGSELLESRADVIGLLETGSFVHNEGRYWNEFFSDYRLVRLKGPMVLLARGFVEVVAEESLGVSSRYAHLRFTRKDESWDVILVDVTSNPLRDRGRVLDRLWEVIAPLLDRPLVVMGDFNTPGSSAHFDRWRDGLTHAFDATGRGFSETWPWPFPVLDIDHVWCGPAVKVETCRLEGSWASDHRKVITEFSRTE